MISAEKWRSGLNLQSGQRGSMGIIEGGRNPEVLVKVHIFWEGHKNIIKSENFFDATKWFQFVLKILSNFSGLLKISEL